MALWMVISRFILRHSSRKCTKQHDCWPRSSTSSDQRHTWCDLLWHGPFSSMFDLCLCSDRKTKHSGIFTLWLRSLTKWSHSNV